jgi:hypothetical protein
VLSSSFYLKEALQPSHNTCCDTSLYARVKPRERNIRVLRAVTRLSLTSEKSSFINNVIKRSEHAREFVLRVILMSPIVLLSANFVNYLLDRVDGTARTSMWLPNAHRVVTILGSRFAFVLAPYRHTDTLNRDSPSHPSRNHATSWIGPKPFFLLHGNWNSSHGKRKFRWSAKKNAI